MKVFSGGVQKTCKLSYVCQRWTIKNFYFPSTTDVNYVITVCKLDWNKQELDSLRQFLNTCFSPNVELPLQIAAGVISGARSSNAAQNFVFCSTNYSQSIAERKLRVSSNSLERYHFFFPFSWEVLPRTIIRNGMRKRDNIWQKQ